VNVKDVNSPPTFVNITPQESLITINKGEAVIFKGEAADLDGDEIKYSWSFGLFDKLKDSAPAIKRTFKTAGDKKIVLTASDGKSKITKTWDVKVTEKPAAPAEKIIQYEGKTYRLSVASPEEQIGANEKIIEKEGVAYKLTVI